MKKTLSVSFVLALLLLLVPAAFATTMTISTNNSWNYLGYTTSSATAPSGTGATFNLTPTPGTWASAISGTSWISWDPQSAPGGTHGHTSSGDPNGYYWYDTTFTVTGTGIDQTIQLMSDDTAEVLIDGIQVVGFGALGSDSRCADHTPNCTKLYSSALAGILTAGTHTLTIVDWQSSLGASGIDAKYSYVQPNIATTPEPGSLLLLGSGLLGLAFVVFRRSRSGAAMNLNM